VIFERALIVRDLYTGGGRAFLNSEDAREFRAAVYNNYGGLHTLPAGCALVLASRLLGGGK
jgi:hypothetical protein